jgi:hypothetical protein
MLSVREVSIRQVPISYLRRIEEALLRDLIDCSDSVAAAPDGNAEEITGRPIEDYTRVRTTSTRVTGRECVDGLEGPVANRSRRRREFVNLAVGSVCSRT